jgi:hypothetical protein
VVDHALCGLDVCESFKLSFQLTLLDLMEALLIILIRQVVNSDLPSLQQVGCSRADRLSQVRFVTSVDLQYSGNLALLQMTNLDWKLVKNIEHKLNNLEGWKAAIWILHQPFLQHGAATKLKKVNLVGFLHQQATGLFKQVKSSHRKA